MLTDNGSVHGASTLKLNGHQINSALEAAMARKVRSFYEVAKTVVTKINTINQKRKLILIADDEPLMYQLIEEFLEEANINCDIATATNGYKAYELAKTLMPNLIISDWLMPEFNGLDLIRKLKRDPVTANIPVILSTGVLASPEELDEFFEAGAIDFIKKPVDYSELKARVRTALFLDDSIKENKSMWESFALNDQVLNHLIASSSIMIFYLDGNGKCLGCSSSFENLFQVDKREILFRPYEEFLPASFAVPLESHFSDISSSGICSEFEVAYKTEKGEKQLLISLKRFGDSLHPLIVGTITDITRVVMVVQDKERELITSDMEKLQADLEFKHRELTMHTELLIHARTAKEELLDGVSKLQPYLNLEGKSKLFGMVRQLQRQLNDETMLSVEKKFDELHTVLYTMLEKYCPDITRNEKRLCAYFRMNHSSADIAKITNRSLNSINVGFARLRTKLKIPSNKDLKAFLNELTVGQTLEKVF